MSQPLTNLGLYGDFSICDKDIISGLNANFQLLDNLVQLAFTGFVATLPPSPAEGDKYILPDGTINLWNGSEWVTYPPQEGYIGYNKDDQKLYLFDGTNWVVVPASTIAFDNTGTTLTSTNLQDAIEEMIVIINSSSLNNVANVGTGAGVFKDITTGTINLRSLVAGYGIDITENTNEIELSVTDYAPIGSIIMSIIDQNYSNYFICDGQEISRSDFGVLFALIGTTYGSGDGSTTFNLPDFQALVPRGEGTRTVNTRTKTGPAIGTVQEDQMQKISGSFTPVSNPEANPAYMHFGGSTVTGAFTKTQASSNRKNAGLTSNYYESVGSFNFNSANSPNARVSSTDDGETRVSSFGVNFLIKVL